MLLLKGVFFMGKNLLFVFYILGFALKSVFFSLKYTHSLVPAVFSGAVFTYAFFHKCYFYYIS